MDGIDTLQSSTPETKAERIARYKAERRRELAERYGNTEEFTSKYVRRDRKIADSSEMVSSTTKEKERSEDESEQTYTRRGLRSKAEAQFTHADDEPAQEKETTTRLKADSVSSSRSEVVSSAKTSSHLRLLATDDTEEPNVDEKPLDSAKRSATSKMSLFKDLDRTEDGSGAYCAKDRPNCQLIGSDEEETSASPGQICKSREMEEKETTDETFPKEQHECDAFEEEKKQPSLQRQDSGPQGIKGILKKSCSTSVESDHSEGSTSECTPVRQSSITLSHPESEEEQKEHEEEQQEEEEEEDEELEEDDEEEVNGDDDQEEEALPDDITDGGGLSTPRQQREGSYSSSGGSSEGMQSPSPAESLEKSSTVSEDVDELESSLEGSMSSSLKQRSFKAHIERQHSSKV